MERKRRICRSTWLCWLVVSLGAATAHAQLDPSMFDLVLGADQLDGLGAAVAVGDFNGDGRADVAVGSPREEVLGLANHGLVRVYLSTPDPGAEGGWGVVVHTLAWCENSSEGKVDQFLGFALAFGHFDDDDRADLAVGIPGGSTAIVDDAGTVCVIYGGDDLADRELWSQGPLPAPASPETGDRFGAALATGDADGNGYDDLAVGAPGEDLTYEAVSRTDAGAVHLILAADNGSGLQSTGAHYRHQGQMDITGEPEDDDEFGAALVMGHFFLSGGGSGQAMDLAVGAPGDQGWGTVTVLASSAGDPLATAFAPMRQGNHSWDLLGTPEAGDRFGASLATGDFNGDGGPDLAIGIPRDDDLAVANDAGAVMVLYGTGSAFGNLDDDDEQIVYEQFVDGSSAGVMSFDRFGTTLAVGDFDRDGHDDLAVGAPEDDSFGFTDGGEVTVIYGSPVGLDLARHQVLHMGLFATPQHGEEFGFGLAAGPTLGGTADDLVIGFPDRDLDMATLGSGGFVTVAGSSLIFTDGFESGDTSAWVP